MNHAKRPQEPSSGEMAGFAALLLTLTLTLTLVGDTLISLWIRARRPCQSLLQGGSSRFPL